MYLIKSLQCFHWPLGCDALFTYRECLEVSPTSSSQSCLSFLWAHSNHPCKPALARPASCVCCDASPSYIRDVTIVCWVVLWKNLYWEIKWVSHCHVIAMTFNPCYETFLYSVTLLLCFCFEGIYTMINMSQRCTTQIYLTNLMWSFKDKADKPKTAQGLTWVKTHRRQQKAYMIYIQFQYETILTTKA